MRVLAIDTSSRDASAALVEDRGGVVSVCSVESREGALGARAVLELVHAVVTPFVKEAPWPTLAVGTGPGSYTGLRTGLATAQGLAAGWETQVFGVPILLAGAAAAFDRSESAFVIPKLIANAEEYFCAVYAFGRVNENPHGIEEGDGREFQITQIKPLQVVSQDRDLNPSELCADHGILADEGDFLITQIEDVTDWKRGGSALWIASLALMTLNPGTRLSSGIRLMPLENCGICRGQELELVYGKALQARTLAERASLVVA